MLPVLPKPPITPRQKKTALVIAGVIDTLQVVVFPAIGLGVILDELLDFVAAFLLTAVCGFKWQFVLAFFIELVPGIGLFPTWAAVVLMLPSEEFRENVTVSAHAPPSTAPSQNAKNNAVEVTAVSIPPVQKAMPASASKPR